MSLTSNDGQTYSDWMDYYAQTRVSENRFGVDYGGIDFNAEFEQAKKAQKSYDSLSSKYNRYKDEPSPEQQNRIEADPEKPHLWDLKERFLEDPKGSQGEYIGHERTPSGGKGDKLQEEKDRRTENYPNPFSDVGKYTPKPLTRPTEPNDALKFWEHPSPKAVIPIREGSMDNGRGSFKVASSDNVIPFPDPNKHTLLQMNPMENTPGIHMHGVKVKGPKEEAEPNYANENIGISPRVKQLLEEGKTRRLTDEEIEETTPGSPGYHVNPKVDEALRKIADYLKSDIGKYETAVAKQKGPSLTAIEGGKGKSVWEKYPPETISDHFDRWLTETGMVPRFFKWLDNKLNPDAGD